MVYKLDVSYSSSQMLTSKFGHLLKSTFFRAEQDIDALCKAGVGEPSPEI